jgi:hypothetical protein
MRCVRDGKVENAGGGIFVVNTFVSPGLDRGARERIFLC